MLNVDKEIIGRTPVYSFNKDPFLSAKNVLSTSRIFYNPIEKESLSSSNNQTTHL